MTADAMLLAAGELFDRLLNSLGQAVDGLDADQLNRAPAPETNSLAVIATHALASTRSWLSLATGAELPPRDRPAEFATSVTDAAAFQAQFEANATACRALIDEAGDFDPALVGYATWGSQPDDPVSSAYSLLHALEHLGEHVGHAELTRQLLDQGAGN